MSVAFALHTHGDGSIRLTPPPHTHTHTPQDELMSTEAMLKCFEDVGDL